MFPRLNPKKLMRLSVIPGSSDYEEKMSSLYHRLGDLKRQGDIGANPLFGPRIMEVLGSSDGLPADEYKALFYEIPTERDRIVIDTLLQRSNLVLPFAVFYDSLALDVGLEKGKTYSNEQLIELVYHPRSKMALSLLDPAVYVRRTPRETLSDLIKVPRSIRTALAAIFCSSALRDKRSFLFSQSRRALEHYALRPRAARERDARTLLSLIATYTWHSNEDLQRYGTLMARTFAVVFSHDNEVHLLDRLWKVLEHAASIQVVPPEMLNTKEAVKNRIIVAKRRSAAKSSHPDLLDAITVINAPGALNWKK